MKNELYFFAVIIAMLFTACDQLDHAIADQGDRIDKLEQSSIKGVEDQITAINASMKELEAVDTELDNYIKALEEKVDDLEAELEEASNAGLEKEIEDLNALIENLKAKDAELEKKIEDIKKYIDEEIAGAKDWANATFATLEQYSSLQTEISTISALIDQQKTDLTEAIEKAIDALETSMQNWVNETLAEGYYDIAAIDAKLKALETLLADADTDLADQIKAQQAALEQARTALTEAYEKAISDAITVNNGVIDENIEKAVEDATEALQKQIDDITTEIDDITDRLKELGLIVDNLSGRIQSIRFMSVDSDGKVELNRSITTLTFLLAPKAVADDIDVANVTAFVSRTKTRAQIDDPTALAVESVTGKGETGLMEVVVNAADLPADFWNDSNNANTYICISDGNNDVISEMVPSFHVPYVTISAKQTVLKKSGEGYTLKMTAAVSTLEYSIDGGATWNELGTDEVAFNNEAAVLLRGKCAEGTGVPGNYATMQISGGDVVCSGDIRTLIDWTDHADADTESASFTGLFKDCTALVDASDLDLLPEDAEMADYCYAEMFSGCTGLTEAPELPATELSEGCYQSMFSDCTSLTEAPELPAPVLTENCYQDMFSGCTELDSVTISATDTSAPGCMDGMLEDVELTEPSEMIVTSVEEITAAPAGSTVRLGGDITVEEAIVIGKTITIDGNDHMLNFTAVTNSRMVEVSTETAGASLTLKNITLFNNVSYVERGVNYNTNGTLTLDNVTVKSAEGCSITYAVNCPGNSDNATVEINQSEITGKIALNLWGENMTVNVVDSELYNYDNTDAENYATIVLNNTGDNSAKGTILTISGGKVFAKDQNGQLWTAVSNPALGTVIISETTEVIGLIRDNVAVVDYGTDQFYGCLTLESAIEKAMEDKALVRMISDVVLEGSITVPAGNELNLDLNGYTLSCESTQTGANFNMIDVRGTLTVQNGTITTKHVGDNMGWNNSTNIFNVTAGGVLNVKKAVCKNLGGSDMNFVAHLNNWGEVTLNVEDSELESPYVAVRVFNSGNDNNNVTIKNTVLTGGRCIWVHNYTLEDFGTQEKVDAHKALLKFNDIFNDGNTFNYTNAAVRLGFTNSLNYDGNGDQIE